MIRFAEKLQPVLLRQPQASTTEFVSQHVRMRAAQWVTFMAVWGTRTTDGTTNPFNFRVFASTAATTVSATAQPFKYRLSSALGTDSWGNITAATAAGVNVDEGVINRLLIIDVDPASITKADANFVHLRVDGRGDGTNPAFGIVGFVEPRFPQNANLSTT